MMERREHLLPAAGMILALFPARFQLSRLWQRLSSWMNYLSRTREDLPPHCFHQ